MDWKRKLGSRKFWLAVAGMVTAIMVALGADSNTTEKITGVVTAGGVVCVYLFAEGNADAKNITNSNEDGGKNENGNE